MSRPQTHDLTLSLGAAGTRVREVVVNRLVDDDFFATIALDGQPADAAVDGRPSDAIVLAVRAGAPIKAHPVDGVAGAVGIG